MPNRDEVSAGLRDLWTDLLDSSDVTEHDRFIESGGTSDRAVRLAARINSELAVDIAWPDVLEVLTMGTFADLTTMVERALADGSTTDRDEPRLVARVPTNTVDDLSDDQVDAMLAALGALPDQNTPLTRRE